MPTGLATERVPDLQTWPSNAEAPVVIIGAGPVGLRTLTELRQRDAVRPIVIYGDEPHHPYNRVQLTSLLAGRIGLDELMLAAQWLDGSCPNTRLVRRHICAISPEQKTVTDVAGDTQAYSELVIAIGSHAHRPTLPGIDLPGVFTFRDLADAEQLAARRVQSQHTVVLGAGLLGVETARAMQRHHTRVTLVDHNPWPMFRQLDETSGTILAEQLTACGVELRMGSGLRMLLGTRRVEGVVLRDGTEVKCDTVVLATGIRPRLGLARDAGLAFGRGIRVDDTMQTSTPGIYAVGECCEHAGEVYGIVAPGFEQAAIAAMHICGEPTARGYQGTQLATSLKVVDMSVFSMGDPHPPASAGRYAWRNDNSYRRIVTNGGRISGIVAIGDWPQLPVLREWSKLGKRVYPWHLWRFKRSGDLVAAEALADVQSWPDAVIVCNCNAVSCGAIRGAVQGGCCNLEAIGTQTRAGTSCGTCKPLLQELMGDASAPEPVRGWRPLGVLSGTALVTALVALCLSIPYPDSVQLPWRWDELWRESLFKQVTGFSILGLVVLSLVLTLRKRTRLLRAGDFDYWRVAHVALTAVALLVLGVHTGFRLGEQLNLLLMLTFLSLIVAGALLGMTAVYAHRMSTLQARRLRAWSLWSHVLLSWPLPALLGMHVLKSYYF